MFHILKLVFEHKKRYQKYILQPLLNNWNLGKSEARDFGFLRFGDEICCPNVLDYLKFTFVKLSER